MALTRAADSELVIDYAPYGAARELFFSREPFVVLSGPAGTGKTLALLQYGHLVASSYEGLRALLVRKTLASLKGSALVTFDEKVRPELDGVKFFGDTAKRPAQYRYPNGATLAIGGMDKPSKVMSSEYDLVIAPELTEFAQVDVEALSSRLRNGRRKVQQLIGDCNPDAPTHWIKQLEQAGKVRLIESRHEHNPRLFDQQTGEMTVEGAQYIARLDALTGVRYLRLRLGIWAAAEGMVYDGWDRDKLLVDRFPATPENPRGDPPAEWPRYWSLDFGYTHPFVWQAWAMDPDGRLYRYHEVYMTHTLVEDHCRVIAQVTKGEPLPRAIVRDHDAEDGATFEKHMGLMTTPAYKAVSPGIQAVAARMRPAGDGKPRIFFLRDSLVERDAELADAKLPTCTEEEVEGYIWDTSAQRKKGEEPVKRNDHGLDAARYLVAFHDVAEQGVQYIDYVLE